MTKHQRLTKRDLSYWKYVDVLHCVQNSNSSVKRSASSSDQGIPRRTMQMLDQFHLFFHDSIENIVNVKADGIKDLRNINLFGSIDRFEELKRSLVDELFMVTMDKWMDITDMRYVIASKYNVILVSLSLQQSMTFFPLRSCQTLISSETIIH
ncbi:hypothetical protein GmHk_13G039687 [Glycine max]|nr:hypothetical protein GmHk_13G039687 [Glycine max]